MIFDWFAQVGSFVAAIAVVVVPGALIAFAGRMRGLALWAFAPVASTAVAGALAIVYGWAGIRWNALSFGVGVLVVAGLAWLIAWRAFPPSPSPRGRASLLTVLGLVGGGLLIAARMGFYIGAPDAISQTNDAVFHLNVLRYIEENGSASSFDITGVLGAHTFYPGAWHALVSVITSVNGGDIPVAVNVVSLVIGALVWPAGIAWLAREATGSLAVGAAAAALSGAMLHFPTLLFEWGVLYPNALALALLPASLAMVWSGIGSATHARWKDLFRLTLFSLIAAVALGLAQPVVLLTGAILVACRAIVWILDRRDIATARRILGAVAFAVPVLALWGGVSLVSGGAHWAPYDNAVEALRELVLTAQVDLPPSPMITVFTALGAWIAWKNARTRPLVIGWALFAVLMGIATSVANPSVRRWLLGPWYADPYRIAATLPLVMIPLTAVGVLWLVRALFRLWPRVRDRIRPAAFGVGASLICGMLVLALWPVEMMPLAPDRIVDRQSRYASTESSYLSPDERTLLSRLDSLVEPGALIIGNPSTGSGFGYALSGANVFPKNWSHPRDDAWKVIGQRLRDAADDPAVCDALQSYGDPQYVLDFGPGEATAGRFLLPGMTGFSSVRGFELVAEVRRAQLWRITACSHSG